MKNLLFMLIGSGALLANANAGVESGINYKPVDLLNYNARLWYNTSAEKKALYRQIYSQALDTITTNVEDQKSKLGAWGAIFALGGTLIEDSAVANVGGTRRLKFEIIESTSMHVSPNRYSLATPGASSITCGIQELGGKVVIISNRSLNSYENVLEQTESELTTDRICFDSIIFARNSADTNKNPRFAAVASGDYENVIASKKFGPLNIIAYFGSDISDFPNLHQNTVAKLAESSPVFDDFGEKYFLVPNPARGSFKENSFN